MPGTSSGLWLAPSILVSVIPSFARPLHPNQSKPMAALHGRLSARGFFLLGSFSSPLSRHARPAGTRWFFSLTVQTTSRRLWINKDGRLPMLFIYGWRDPSGDNRREFYHSWNQSEFFIAYWRENCLVTQQSIPVYHHICDNVFSLKVPLKILCKYFKIFFVCLFLFSSLTKLSNTLHPYFILSVFCFTLHRNLFKLKKAGG